MRVLRITSLVAAGIAAAFIGLTYPRHRRDMQAFKARLAGSAILNTDQGEIEYVVEGQGAPVLSLHGAGGGWDQGIWAARLALGDGHKVISVSRYGYLGTPIPQHASVKTQAALYKALLGHLGVQKVLVLGSSAGGPSGTQFANDYPDMTSALILVSAVSEASAPGDKPPFYTGIMHLIQRSDYAYWLVARFMRPMVLNLVGVPADVYAKFTPFEKQMAQGMLDTMHPMSERYRGTVNDGKMLQREPVTTGNVSARTLILHAKDDALVSFRHAERAHRVIRRSRLILFEAGGHGMLSRMKEVRQSVREFLEQR